MYKFSIKIDDTAHTLTAEDGISMEKIANLLASLYKVIDPDGLTKCTLSSIRGNCYALDFSTESDTQERAFQVVHKNLEYIPLEDMEEPQRGYAKTVRSILGNKYYLNAYDKDNNKIASISGIKSDIHFNHYYNQETIYGIVTELGGRSLTSEKKHIYVDGYDYRISISNEIDFQLKHFYGTDKLMLKIRTKKSVLNGKTISAELIEFTTLSKGNLSQSFDEVGYIDLEIFNPASIEATIDRIYGHAD